MHTRGFTLLEVLISLFLLTLTALSFLKQHWQGQQVFNRLSMRHQALIELDNITEKIMAGEHPQPDDQRFILHSKKNATSMMVQISWKSPALGHEELKRQLALTS